MLIKSNKTINQIQEEFNTLFPYLKLEFYVTAHKTGEGSPKREQIHSSTNLSAAGDKNNNGELHIFDSMQVCELEQQFETVYGLHVQVFRKSGSIWLQTISTDEWTLKEQNAHGMNSIKKELS